MKIPRRDGEMKREKQAEYDRLVLKFAEKVQAYQQSNDKNERWELIRETREIAAQARALVGVRVDNEESDPETPLEHHGLFVVGCKK